MVNKYAYPLSLYEQNKPAEFLPDLLALLLLRTRKESELLLLSVKH